ncbi:glycosyl hydrolase 2 galactose-binding domain-containing protein [Cupriavidus sp. 30B13]|uniref:glycosyl hydrolase 2 galactose-binding domain-containing protein n=1 Tax=Cupriavidus sp. 30B13 TaxID=3384241 RepID=UPI003B90B66F
MHAPLVLTPVPGRPACRQPLEGGWTLLETPAGAAASPAALAALAGHGPWLPASVPGTVAQALQAAGQWQPGAPRALHDHDYWYRVPLRGAGAYRLRLHGLATVAEVWLDETRVLDAHNMFTAHEAELHLDGDHVLYLCFRALHRWLRGQRGPVRWKPRLVTPPSLRLVRTTLLGHMPGWCPPVHAVGPWRGVDLLPLDSASPLLTARYDLHAALDAGLARGVIRLRLRDVAPLPPGVPLMLCADGREAPLDAVDAGPGGIVYEGELAVPAPRLWWPHTHGAPERYAVQLRLGELRIDCAQVGFRRIEAERATPEGGEGFALRVNGERIFCRGACWTSHDLAGHADTPAAVEKWLALAHGAGMNMVRVSGVTCYQGDAFFDACDALGLLVWQDFMFANFDYSADAAAARPLMAQATREVSEWLAAHRHHPSVAVLCGGSEVEQQAAMMGVAADAWRQPLFDEIIPACLARWHPDAVYVRNSPSGGAWPFQPDSGVTHYYGVGAYQRPLEDARRANVRFTSECLAFANVPCARTMAEALAVPPVHDPRWKARVPRDAGSGWDFEDVRDFYLRELFKVDPPRLRYEDAARYLQLSRAVVAEVMTDVFSEWRRCGSTCAGALVWQLQDLLPGAGWGIVDALARPKSAWHALRQVWQPLQVLVTDEGLNGIHLHLINEGAAPRAVRLQLQCWRDGETALLDVTRELCLAPRSTQRVSGAELAGAFFDFTYAYRFGPRMHDVVRAALYDPADGALLSQACYLPERSAAALEPPELAVEVAHEEGDWWLTISARRFARWVHIEDVAMRPEQDWFHLAPGSRRRVRLLPEAGIAAADGGRRSVGLPDTAPIPMGEVHALNARRALAYSAPGA